MGWEQAISIDGRFLPSIMSDVCPHMLLMLTRPSAGVALTQHLLLANSGTSKVLTFTSRENEVTLLSNFQVKFTNKRLLNCRI